MSLIVGKVIDIDIDMHVETPTSLFGAHSEFSFVRIVVPRRTLDVSIKIDVYSMPLDNFNCVHQLREEIVCDINESLGNGNKRPGAVLIEQLQIKNSNLAHRATKAESEVVRLQKIIDDFQQANTQLLMNSSTLRELSRKQESKKK